MKKMKIGKHLTVADLLNYNSNTISLIKTIYFKDNYSVDLTEYTFLSQVIIPNYCLRIEFDIKCQSEF